MAKPLPSTWQTLFPSKQEQDKVIEQAKQILESRVREAKNIGSTPAQVTEYLKLHYSSSEREVFTVLYCNNHHELIDIKDMFLGTVAECTVYPREVIKQALLLNAAALVLAHCHPGGNPEPSKSDKKLTALISSAGSMLGVRVIDHIIVAGSKSFSFAENAML